MLLWKNEIAQGARNAAFRWDPNLPPCPWSSGSVFTFYKNELYSGSCTGRRDFAVLDVQTLKIQN